jgi:hypothetical protein
MDKRKIAGRDNCFEGDCLDCHNVNCMIHQGFQEAEYETPETNELVAK